jgi:hypothetical protein
MRVSNSLVALLGAASTVAALQNPHEKAPKRNLAAPVVTRNAPRKTETTTFLTKNSKSKALSMFNWN